MGLAVEMQVLIFINIYIYLRTKIKSIICFVMEGFISACRDGGLKNPSDFLLFSDV
jgi:hypothetical protein